MRKQHHSQEMTCVSRTQANQSYQFRLECIYMLLMLISLEGKANLEEELKRADVIVLTYACDKPETLDSLQNLWIHEIRRLELISGDKTRNIVFTKLTFIKAVMNL